MRNDTAHQRRIQGDYHHGLFHALDDWDRSYADALDLAGDPAQARALGLDQLGHFGPPGCDLVVAALTRLLPPGGPLTLAELGCGLGGALRHLTTGLRARGRTVATPVGIDIVAEHIRLCARIAAATGPPVRPLQADVHALPLRTGCLDAVVCTGSLPHFPDPGAVLAEAFRVLRPGGVLVMTEEVSLVRAGRTPSAGFRRFHPPGVFFLTGESERLRQLTEAGFLGIRIRDLTDWAAALLRDRLKVMEIFSGDVAAIFGQAEADLLRATLAAARREYEAGTIRPALVTAYTPADTPGNPQDIVKEFRDG
ncbi:class I SAM-dependent methyltransferase [Streptomyces orinoci]|uniref:Methyltransferase domain-containing protein n=1 Tax=Streptomyces orinoci TaxID=67339 RepID=A0ABV3JQL8_STRON|nr:class I SAM-dependent methyltransferase [Streptomyces orinoci]